MQYKRSDSFRIALDTLRSELRTAVHAPDSRLTANAIAERLALSATPVREALSRLAGEGLLLDRRGQGFFVPRLSEREISNLFRLQLEFLLIASAGEVAARPSPAVERIMPPDGDRRAPQDLVDAGEQLLRAVATAAGAALLRQFSHLQDQLAPVRACEPLVLDGLADELAQLSETISARDPQALRRALAAFHDRRIGAAQQLARLHEASKNIESI